MKENKVKINESSKPLKRLATLILGIFLFIFIINCYFIYLCNDCNINSQSMVIKRKWRKLFNLSKPVDWVILGDSSCTCGIDEKYFELRMNKSATNLCTVGNSLILGDYLMLEYLIKNIGVPKNVLIVHVYDIWERNFDITCYSEIPFKYGYWNNLIPLGLSNLNNLIKLHIVQYLPIYSKNITLRRIAENAIYKNKKHKNIMLKDGSTRGEANPEEVLKDAELHIQKLRIIENFSISKINREYMEKIFQLSEKYQFKVYLINGPMYNGLYSDSGFQNYFQQVEGELLLVSNKYPNVKYIPSNKLKLLFDKNQMSNSDHVAKTVVKPLTRKIVQVLKKEQL